MTELQRQFEEWAKKNGYNLTMVAPLIGDKSTDNAIYANGQTRSAWFGWQASRSTLVVKLPDWFFASGSRLAMDRDSVIKALDVAGVRYE